MDNNPYLIQRLEKARHDFVPFEKGAGVGGSNESRALVKGFAGHDYMGSSEFEWGALPKAYEALGKAVKTGYTKFKTEFFGKKVYGFCKKTDLPEVMKFISEEALDSHNHRLKESTYFYYALGKGGDMSSLGNYILGWFDIDNLFMWFRDQEMFDQFTNFYGIADWS